jgi:hypothetical protein
MSNPNDLPEEMRRAIIEAASRPWDLRPRFRIIGDAISQLFNACHPGGAADESLSGRSYRITELSGDRPPIYWQLVRWAAEALFWYWDRGNHCQIAFWEDVFRCRSRAAVADAMATAIELQTWGSGDSLPDNESIPTEQA